MNITEFLPDDSSTYEIVWENKPSRVFYTIAKSGKPKPKFTGKFQMSKILKLRLAAIAAGSIAYVGGANAALDTSITTALTTAGTDGAAMGAAVLVVIVAIYAFKLMRRAL